ncbi:universal stress protein A-like protein [Tanacetum coccineum]
MESETIIGETSTNNGQQQNTLLPLRKKKLSVMVAVDESDVSLYALKWTLEHLFKKHVVVDPVMGEEVDPEPDPEQGMVTVVHVMEPFERYMFPAEPSMYASASMVESVRKAQHQNAAELLSRAFQICKQTKIKAETLILEGDPKEMLCQAVEQMHFDLLVVGSRGLSAIKSAISFDNKSVVNCDDDDQVVGGLVVKAVLRNDGDEEAWWWRR